jgi:hypothetical protein
MKTVQNIIIAITNATLLTTLSFQSAHAQIALQELVGTWVARSGSGSSYVDSSTGASSAPNGEIDRYMFGADGQYEHAFLGQQSLYNCSTRLFGREVGSFSADGSILQLVAPPGVVEFEDTCNSNNNTHKTSSPTETTMIWRLDQDQYGRKLCLRQANTRESCYYQQ